MIPVDRMPTRPITASRIVVLSYTIISENGGKEIEAGLHHAALVKDQARFHACTFYVDVVRHAQGCPDIRQGLVVNT